MSRNGFHAPQKALWVSQNFLTSARVIDGLLRRSSITPADHVLEIGPGKGHITRRLLPRCGRLTAIELDAALYAGLCSRYGQAEGLRLLHGDFLDMRLPQGPYKVFANIPFSITTRIMDKLTQAGNPPEDAYLIMQREAAQRFAAPRGFQLRALSLAPFFQARIVCQIPREAFHPMPGVDCVLLHLHRRATPDLASGQRAAWTRFLQAMQSGRPPLSAHQMRTILRQQQLLPMDATLRYVQWLCLFRWVSRSEKNKR